MCFRLLFESLARMMVPVAVYGIILLAWGVQVRFCRVDIVCSHQGHFTLLHVLVVLCR